MRKLPPPPSKRRKDNIKRIRTSSTRREDHSRQRKDSRSAWSLASSRFDHAPKTPHVHREKETKPKRTSQDCSSAHSTESVDLSINIDSDTEILLSPPKANILVQGIRDIIENNEMSTDLRQSPSGSSYGTLMSFGTGTFSENPQPFRKKSKISLESDEQKLKMDIDQYIRERYPSCASAVEEIHLNDDNGNAKNISISIHDEEARAANSLQHMERKMERLENDFRRDVQIDHRNKSTEEKKDDGDLVKALLLAAQLLGLNADGHFDPHHLREQMEREKREEIDNLRSRHEKDILKMKEDYKQDVIDLQDRMLQWMGSRVDLVRQQERTIFKMKHELDIIRDEYNELKETSKEAFDKGTQSVAINCSKLKSYVQEEIREAYNESDGVIESLKAELKSAQDKIIALEKGTIDCHVHQAVESVSSLDSNSARQHHRHDDDDNKHDRRDCDDASTWNDFTVKVREALEGNVPQQQILPPSDASVLSKLEVYDTMTADKLFKNLCSNKQRTRTSPVLSKKNSSKSELDFFDCGQATDDADIFMDATSGEI